LTTRKSGGVDVGWTNIENANVSDHFDRRHLLPVCAAARCSAGRGTASISTRQRNSILRAAGRR
jgi:hypothetical protein